MSGSRVLSKIWRPRSAQNVLSCKSQALVSSLWTAGVVLPLSLRGLAYKDWRLPDPQIPLLFATSAFLLASPLLLTADCSFNCCSPGISHGC